MIFVFCFFWASLRENRIFLILPLTTFLLGGQEARKNSDLLFFLSPGLLDSLGEYFCCLGFYLSLRLRACLCRKADRSLRESKAFISPVRFAHSRRRARQESQPTPLRR